jgi:hypothetical protein
LAGSTTSSCDTRDLAGRRRRRARGQRQWTASRRCQRQAVCAARRRRQSR